VIGDLRDARSLRAAAEGMNGVFHINPAFAPGEAEMGVAMVRAAKDAGVRKFVFSSVIHPAITRLVNHREKLPVEEAIYESGMTFTVLQPTMFMQTIENGWDQILKTRRFALPYSMHVKASYVDYHDVAEVASIAMMTHKLDYGTFELCAEGMYSRVELTALMGEALMGPVEPGEVPFEDWARSAGIPEGPVREGMRAMYADYDEHGFPGGNALVLKAVLRREPMGLREFLHELAARRKKAA
jgi:uncharacterized protein YbjT (DUF2867 family)